MLYYRCSIVVLLFGLSYAHGMQDQYTFTDSNAQPESALLSLPLELIPKILDTGDMYNNLINALRLRITCKLAYALFNNEKRAAIVSIWFSCKNKESLERVFEANFNNLLSVTRMIESDNLIPTIEPYITSLYYTPKLYIFGGSTINKTILYNFFIGCMAKPHTTQFCSLLIPFIDVNYQDFVGNTLLYTAVKHRNIEAVELLLEHGITKYSATIDLKTSVDYIKAHAWDNELKIERIRQLLSKQMTVEESRANPI